MANTLPPEPKPCTLCSLILKGFRPQRKSLGETTQWIHPNLDNQSPIEFERRFIGKAKAANDEALLQNNHAARPIQRAA